MTSPSDMQTQLSQSLKDCLPSEQAAPGPSPSALLSALIDAFPKQNDADIFKLHRGALDNLLEMNLPNHAIRPHPDYQRGTVSYYPKYTGPSSGYQNAFFGGVTQSAAATAVAAQVKDANASLNTAWWGNYAVAVLTDAIRQQLNPPLDTNKLATDLANYHKALLPALSASYLAVFTAGYKPTVTGLKAITDAGMAKDVAGTLAAAIEQGRFTANVNQAIQQGGQAASAATWYLFNLWITLKALGADSVDSVITQAQNAGLMVPQVVGPGDPQNPSKLGWWNGGYTTWFAALSGSDVLSDAYSTIVVDMPQTADTLQGQYSTGPVDATEQYGYAYSFCSWGDLSWYKPAPSSCLGKGTHVLMADGSMRAIEEIAIGDEIQTTAGPQKVVLIGSPGRLGRPLYRISGLSVYATAGHPFLGGQGAGSRYVAVEPWTLIDNLPSMTESGVASLRVGAAVSGCVEGRLVDIPVTEIVEQLPTDDDERVYNLWLEDWASGSSAYFVGDAACCLAAAPEMTDPNYNLPCTVAILSAFHAAMDACRQHFPHPEQAGSLGEAIASARVAANAFGAPTAAAADGLTATSVLPDLSFFQQDGGWDPYASTLIEQLIRSHARAIRRRLYHPLVSIDDARVQGAQLGVCLHDIELLGEFGVAGHAELSVELQLRCDAGDEKTERISLGQTGSDRWFICADRVIDMGVPLPDPGTATLTGIVAMDGAVLGRFRCEVGTSLESIGGQEHFLFSDTNGIVGRVALSAVPIADPDLLAAVMAGRQAEPQPMMAAALSLGEQLGGQVAERAVHYSH
jgi:hypothetical protein